MKTKKILSSCTNCKTSNKQCSCFDCSICCKSHDPKNMTVTGKQTITANQEHPHSEFIINLSMDLKNFSDHEIMLLYKIIYEERHKRHVRISKKAACRPRTLRKNDKNINSDEN